MIFGSFFDELGDGRLHIMGPFIDPHDAVVFGTVGEVGGIDLRGHLQPEDVALLPDLDKDFGVLSFALQVVLYGFQLVQVVGRKVQPLGQFAVALFVAEAVDDLGVLEDACGDRIARQLVDGLQYDADGPVLLPDGLIVEFHAFQYVVELELFGELVEQDDALFGPVAPDGPLDGGLDQFQHHRQHFLVVPYLVQFENDQAFVLDLIGLVPVDLEQETVEPVPYVFRHDVQEVGNVEIGGIDAQFPEQAFPAGPDEVVEPFQGMTAADRIFIVMDEYFLDGHLLCLGDLKSRSGELQKEHGKVFQPLRA